MPEWVPMTSRTWQVIAEQVSCEKDPVKLLRLVEELKASLTVRSKRRGSERSVTRARNGSPPEDRIYCNDPNCKCCAELKAMFSAGTDNRTPADQK
jgi:hypothetical protein